MPGDVGIWIVLAYAAIGIWVKGRVVRRLELRISQRIVPSPRDKKVLAFLLAAKFFLSFAALGSLFVLPSNWSWVGLFVLFSAQLWWQPLLMWVLIWRHAAHRMPLP